MSEGFFQDYSKSQVHFYDGEVSFLLRLGLVLAGESTKKPRIIDLGCGDGRLIFALHKHGLLKNTSEIVGADVSGIRIARLTKELPFVRGVIMDALNVEESLISSFDYVICSQLIEHVEDDGILVSEIRRLLRHGGLAYVSSVVKKWYGVYFYFKGGSFKLDPTHQREYSSVCEFEGLIKNKGFNIIDVRTRQVVFPISDLFIRLLIRVGLIEAKVRFFEQRTILNKARRLGIPVVGYNSVEVLAKRIE